MSLNEDLEIKTFIYKHIFNPFKKNKYYDFN